MAGATEEAPEAEASAAGSIDGVLASQRTAGYVAGSFGGLAALFVAMAWVVPRAGDDVPRFDRA